VKGKLAARRQRQLKGIADAKARYLQGPQAEHRSREGQADET
jgi:hypothetical protein